MNTDDKAKKALRRHPLLIPPGNFCYRVEPIDDGVEIPPTSLRLGVDLREASFGIAEKMVLCPYWVLTDNWTVRCDYLNIEVPSRRGGGDSQLAEKLKACDIRPAPSCESSLASPFPGGPEKR